MLDQTCKFPGKKKKIKKTFFLWQKPRVMVMMMKMMIGGGASVPGGLLSPDEPANAVCRWNQCSWRVQMYKSPNDKLMSSQWYHRLAEGWGNQKMFYSTHALRKMLLFAPLHTLLTRTLLPSTSRWPSDISCAQLLSQAHRGTLNLITGGRPRGQFWIHIQPDGRSGAFFII